MPAKKNGSSSEDSNSQRTGLGPQECSQPHKAVNRESANTGKSDVASVAPPGLEPKATFWGQPQATVREPQAAFGGQPQATVRKPDDGELKRVAEALGAAGIENTGVKLDETPGRRYVAFKDPDRIAWEFYTA